MQSFISLINRNKSTVVAVLSLMLVSLSMTFFLWDEDLSQHQQASLTHFSANAAGNVIEWKSLVEQTDENQFGFVLNQDAKIIHFDPDHLKKLGYVEEQVINQEFFPFIHPEDLPEVMVSMIKAFQSGEDLSNVGPYRFKANIGDDDYRYFIATINPIKDKAGKVTHLVVIQKDITYGLTPESKPAAPKNSPTIRHLKEEKDLHRIVVER